MTAEWDHGWRRYHVCCFRGIRPTRRREKWKTQAHWIYNINVQRSITKPPRNASQSIGDGSNRPCIFDIITLNIHRRCWEHCRCACDIFNLGVPRRMSKHALTFFLIRNVSCFCILGLHDKTLLFMIYYDTLHKLLHCFVDIYICAVSVSDRRIIGSYCDIFKILDYQFSPMLSFKQNLIIEL